MQEEMLQLILQPYEMIMFSESLTGRLVPFCILTHVFEGHLA